MSDCSPNKVTKRKRNVAETNLTVVNRNLISANWQALLNSKVMEEAKEEYKKPTPCTTFRRNAKKNKQIGTDLQDNLKNLKLNKESLTNGNTITNGKIVDIKRNTTMDCELADINRIQIPKEGLNKQQKGKANKQNCSNLQNNLKVLEESHTNVTKPLTDKKIEGKRDTITKFLAMDCEMVGIGYDGKDNMLGRISIVNKFGDCIYDKFVKAREKVIDYRTEFSGIRKEDLLNGEDFKIVQKEVADIIKGKILVGHALKNDLSVLYLSHPKKCIRDTAKYKPFRKISKGGTPSLKMLAREILGIEIQSGEHSSVEDAKAVMQIYCTAAKKWEAIVNSKRVHTRNYDDC